MNNSLRKKRVEEKTENESEILLPHILLQLSSHAPQFH
jgi:hypothetical protein